MIYYMHIISVSYSICLIIYIDHDFLYNNNLLILLNKRYGIIKICLGFLVAYKVNTENEQNNLYRLCENFFKLSNYTKVVLKIVHKSFKNQQRNL